MPKKQKKKTPSDFKAFFKDLRLLDKTLLIFLIAVLFVSFLATGFVFNNNGSMLGISSDLFAVPTIYSDPFVIPTPASYPIRLHDTQAPFVTASAAIVLDAASQVVLYEKNKDVVFPPASTTKIMTALVAMDYFKPEDILQVPTLSESGSEMGLVPFEQISFENLLYGLLLNSGNDAAETLAKNAPSGRSGFITAMNERAKQFHLESTHFQNVSGLESENHYTTALDLARLASVALKNPSFAKIVSTRVKTVSDVTGTYIHPLENINKLLGTVAGVEGVKTGYTQEAGQVLVTSATRAGHTIITVVLRSEDRFLDSKNLLEWAFANFSFISLEETSSAY